MVKNRGDKWNGKSGKLTPFKERRQNKRISFILPAERTDKGDCLPKDYNPRENTGNPIARPRLYTPEQQYNYKSRYARYVRALDLKPAQIIQTSDGCTEYKFYSCNALTGFYTVKVCPVDQGTYVEAGEPLTIICPPGGGFKLTQAESDGTAFKWTQISGSRTVLFDDDTILNPTIFIQASCFTNGCNDTSPLPIILQVTLANNPEIFDTLIIYNTITSTNYGVSSSPVFSAPDNSDCRAVPCEIISAPIYGERAYCNDGSVNITWKLPTCETQFVYETVVQANSTGQYVDEEVFGIGEDRIFETQPGVTYRIAARFNQYGNYSEKYGCSFRFSGNEDIAFVDNTNSGASAIAVSSSIVKREFAVKRITVEDFNYGVSAVTLGNTFNVLPLAVKLVNPDNDINYGASATALNGSIEKFNLGGIVIG